MQPHKLLAIALVTGCTSSARPAVGPSPAPGAQPGQPTSGLVDSIIAPLSGRERVAQFLDSLAALPPYMALDTLRRAFPFLTCQGNVVPYGSAGDHWCVGRTSGLFVSVTTREGRLIEMGAQEWPPLVLGAWARARHGPPAGTCEHSVPRSPDGQAGSLTYTWWTRRVWTLVLSSHPKFAAIGLILTDVPLASLHCDPGTLRQTP